MTCQSVYFSSPGTVTLETRPIPDPGPDEVRVNTERSAVSAGTELLVYNGNIPDDIEIDENISALSGAMDYPLQYGYTTVGRVTAVGTNVADDWLGQQVFAFHPHASHFLSKPGNLIPTSLAPERALLIPNTEAAINFVMDGRPRIGERIIVFGQGPVGLVTTAVLDGFPLEELIAVDPLENRRALAERLGADQAVEPAAIDDTVGETGSDLTIELSGNPAALDAALDVTGYAGRVLVGSWYGSKQTTLDLGGEFHRSHIRVRSSQVSQIDPDHSDRWDKQRRLAYVCNWLNNSPQDNLADIQTHEFPIQQAQDAYEFLNNNKDEAIQITFKYP